MASYSKTGTKTIAKALSILGYNIYDFEEHFLYHHDQWQQIFNGQDPIPIFKKMYKNVDAIMDVPTYHYWQQISQAFPEAKILFVERDADKWVKSVISMFEIINDTRWFDQAWKRTLARPLIYCLSPTLLKFSDWMDTTFTQAIGPNLDTIGKPNNQDRFSRSNMKTLYEKHSCHVKMLAPKDRFLVFEMKQGWEPLCEFLEKEVPKNVEFPHSNQKGSIVGDIYDGGDNRKGRAVINREIRNRMGIFLSVVCAVVAIYFVAR